MCTANTRIIRNRLKPIRFTPDSNEISFQKILTGINYNFKMAELVMLTGHKQLNEFRQCQVVQNEILGEIFVIKYFVKMK